MDKCNSQTYFFLSHQTMQKVPVESEMYQMMMGGQNDHVVASNKLSWVPLLYGKGNLAKRQEVWEPYITDVHYLPMILTLSFNCYRFQVLTCQVRILISTL